MELNTENWKSFPLTGKNGRKGGLLIIKRGGTQKKPCISGDINFVSASKFNNGITLKAADNGCVVKGGKITISNNGSAGFSFWQEDDFMCSNDVYYCEPNWDDYPDFVWNKNVGLFLCSIIREIGKKYEWQDKWSLEKIGKDVIPLPVTPDGKPDYQFMEDYINSMYDKCMTRIENYL
jgi:hypothetical protein